jgi:hypothetical protein
MRVPVLFILLLGALGCSPPVSPPGDASDDLASDATSSVDSLCAALIAREQSCQSPQCQIDDLQRACPSFASHLRPEAVTALMDCAQHAPACPADAGATSALDQCFAAATASLTPTSAQRDAASSICMACPAAAGDPMATASECQANFFQRTDAGDNGAGSLLLMFDDATARTAGQSCAASAADAGTFCGVNVALCTIVAVGIPLGTSCQDGG